MARKASMWAKAAGEYYRKNKGRNGIESFSDVLKSSDFKAAYYAKYGKQGKTMGRKGKGMRSTKRYRGGMTNGEIFEAYGSKLDKRSSLTDDEIDAIITAKNNGNIDEVLAKINNAMEIDPLENTGGKKRSSKRYRGGEGETPPAPLPPAGLPSGGAASPSMDPIPSATTSSISAAPLPPVSPQVVTGGKRKGKGKSSKKRRAKKYSYKLFM
jgi:hypothetical protein